MATPGDRSPRLFTRGKIVKVTVGPDNSEHFYIHKDLICECSKVFRSYLEILEDDEHDQKAIYTVRLGNDFGKKEVFSYIVDWLYGFGTPPYEDVDSEIVLLKAYKLTEGLKIVGYRNQALDAIRRQHQHHLVSVEVMRAVYKLFQKAESPVRKFYTDQFAYDLQHHFAETGHVWDGEMNFDSAFFQEAFEMMPDVLAKMAENTYYAKSGKDLENPSWSKGCAYHDHEGDEDPCPGT